MPHSSPPFTRLVLAGILAFVSAASAAEGRRPNIVLILIDDMGYRDIACNGSRFFETSNIDRLASQGMRFTDAYAACPVCSPTRLSIMSGKYPARVHLTNYIAGNRWPDNSPLTRIRWRPYMPPEEVTIAEALKAAGYRTGTIGKWHLNSRGENERLDTDTQPNAQGFDEATGRVPNQTDKGAAGMTDRAVEFITANKDRPFFLYLCHHSVHIPLEATPDLVEKYRRKIQPDDPQNNPTYGGMVESVDRSVGRVMAALDEAGVADRTILIFCSDNGGLNVKEGANTPATSNLPLRDGKGYLHEGGVRIPLIVRWPREVPAGATCGTPVSTVDFYPTILDVLQSPPPAGQVLDGVSLLPLLTRSGDLQREAIFWHYPHYSNQGGSPGGAVRRGDDKLIESYEDGALELYNLRDDPGEQNNLAASLPEKAATLRRMLDEWRRSVDAQMPARNPSFDPSQPRYSDPAKAPQALREK